MPKVVGIVWASHSNRLDEIVTGIGGKPEKISLLSGKKFLAPIRYLYLGIKTIHILRSERAEIVIAQDPPIFCALSAYIAMRFSGKKLVIDHHSLAREKQGWLNRRILGRIEEWLMRKALVNTVIHEGYSKILKDLGIKALVLYDLPPEMPVHRGTAGGAEGRDFTVVCPLGGHPDEEVDALIDTVERTRGVKLVITGRWANPLEDLKAHTKIEYAGFLSREEYVKRISEADLGVCLLKENEMTLPYVLFEFASAELPFLVSNTKTTSALDESFLVKDEEELLVKIEGLRQEDNYRKSVEKTKELKAYLIAKSRGGRESLRRLLA